MEDETPAGYPGPMGSSVPGPPVMTPAPAPQPSTAPKPRAAAKKKAKKKKAAKKAAKKRKQAKKAGRPQGGEEGQEDEEEEERQEGREEERRSEEQEAVAPLRLISVSGSGARTSRPLFLFASPGKDRGLEAVPAPCQALQHLGQVLEGGLRGDEGVRVDVSVGDQAESLADAVRGVVEGRLDRELLVVEPLGVDPDPRRGW